MVWSCRCQGLPVPSIQYPGYTYNGKNRPFTTGWKKKINISLILLAKNSMLLGPTNEDVMLRRVVQQYQAVSEVRTNSIESNQDILKQTNYRRALYQISITPTLISFSNWRLIRQKHVWTDVGNVKMRLGLWKVFPVLKIRREMLLLASTKGIAEREPNEKNHLGFKGCIAGINQT